MDWACFLVSTGWAVDRLNKIFSRLEVVSRSGEVGEAGVWDVDLQRGVGCWWWWRVCAGWGYLGGAGIDYLRKV